MLDSVQDNMFYLQSDVINKVEVTKAQFVSLGPASLRFDLWGYLDFNVPTGNASDDTVFPFDVFGFGFTTNPNQSRAGLAFSGLAIAMTIADNKTSAATFETAAISFDPAPPASTPRNGSLYQAFALQLKGLLVGDDKNTPAAQNYLNVPTNAALAGIDGKPRWYALAFGLKMGTAGALAGKLGLDASLIVAWSPGSAPGDASYGVMIGLQLPGVTAKSKLLSLEGILALSIGSMRLTYDVPPNATQRYWVLWLTEIALKFMGLLKIPPNGSSSFVCFGNPDANGKPTALGWYAAYNQDEKKQSVVLADPQGSVR
jgi:hypothetical protein